MSKEYKKAASKMLLSYSKKAYPWDNAYILVFQYIEIFYNTIRIHSHCNYMSPNEFEKAYEKFERISMSTAS